jgi:hypothetical protein
MAAPNYQSIASFDYVVSPHSDDFGPFTAGTLTGGLQEALATAGAGGSVFVRKGTYNLHTNIAQKGNNQILFCEPGVTFLAASDYAPGFGVVGMFSLGQDGTSDYDGFAFEGNGCLIDGQNFASTAGLFVTGRTKEVFRFSLRNFRVQNCVDYGLGIGRVISVVAGSIISNVLVESFDLYNCGWIRIWGAEHVVVRHGRCRRLPSASVDGWFITAQHSLTGNLVCRDVVLEDLIGNSNVTDVGGFTGYAALQIEASAATTNTDLAREVFIRRCYLRTNAGAGVGSGGILIDDASTSAGPGTVESVTFEDSTFDGPGGSRYVGNASEGYVLYDHCEFVSSAALPSTTFLAGSQANRPLMVRRPYSSVTYPNQNFGITVGASPFTFTNTHRYVMVVIVSGGTSVTIDFIPRGGVAVPTGETAGAFNLSSGDALRVSYAAAPTMTGAPLS